VDIDKKYLVWGLCYAVAGMVLGIYMAASENHGQLVTHAHILMVGFVLSFVYGLIHRLWLHEPGRGIANLQFVLHQLAAITLSAGLFLLYGGLVAEQKLIAILGLGSVCVLLGMLLMLYMAVRFGSPRAVAGRQAAA
jgi:surface polysaccharide O-acyltransferase-like enzyme